MEPAKTIIERLGGEKNVAGVTGTALTSPYRWQHPVEKGGTGGRIPAKHIRTLLEYAAENNMPVKLEDFFADEVK